MSAFASQELCCVLRPGVPSSSSAPPTKNVARFFPMTGGFGEKLDETCEACTCRPQELWKQKSGGVLHRRCALTASGVGLLLGWLERVPRGFSGINLVSWGLCVLKVLWVWVFGLRGGSPSVFGCSGTCADLVESEYIYIYIHGWFPFGVP